MTQIFTSPLGPTLETGRLILRPPVASDFDGFCAFHGDAETVKFLGGVQSPSLVWRTMRVTAGSWALDGFSMFSVLDRTTGEWMGRVGPIYPEGWPAREVGWGLMRRFWGQGFAREAAIAAIDYAFEALGWDDVIHVIAPENVASAGVARSLGSINRKPGRLPDPYADVAIDIWGQSRDDWRVNRARLLK